MTRMKNFIFYVLPVIFLAVACTFDNCDELPVQQVDRISVATYNVDGLPVSYPLEGYGLILKPISSLLHLNIDEDFNLEINPGGPGAENSELIGKKISERGWDVFGLNEDFNFHEEIWKSLDGYNQGRYMGSFGGDKGDVLRKVLAKKRLFDIDGLEFGARKKFRMDGEVIRPWIPEAVFGYLTNDSDSLTVKGFRYYQVHIDEQTAIDFIVLHADAGSAVGDILAREAAMGQLYDFIKTEVDSVNPLVIMGDFNCRYSRDNLKGLFIDRLNADPALKAADAWIEMKNAGTASLLDQTEMLDKIIYVNRQNAPVALRLVSASNVLDFVDEDGKQLSDHHPLEATFDIIRRAD